MTEFAIGTKVQDSDGFTGTVTDGDGSGYVEVVWDVSGCSSIIHENELKPMQPGQDNDDVQAKLHRETFGED